MTFCYFAYRERIIQNCESSVAVAMMGDCDLYWCVFVGVDCNVMAMHSCTVSCNMKSVEMEIVIHWDIVIGIGIVLAHGLKTWSQALAYVLFAKNVLVLLFN